MPTASEPATSLVVAAIVGPTASGKSALALEWARAVSGTELVSLDSMQVYRGMDIGTAKPSVAEQRDVRHHLIDLVDPGEEMTVARFQAEFRAVMADLDARGVPALLVGGTGLYLRAVVDDLDIPGRYPEVRDRLDAEPDTASLHARLAALDPTAAARMESTNRRRILRALEVTLGSGRPFSSFGPGLDTYPPCSFPLVGLRLARTELDLRITTRFHQLMDRGLLDEVRRLAAHPGGLSRTARQALGYRELLAHVETGRPLDECIDEAITRTRQFARRQERWFRRDPRIRWVDATGDPSTDLAACRDAAAPHAGAGPRADAGRA